MFLWTFIGDSVVGCGAGIKPRIGGGGVRWGGPDRWYGEEKYVPAEIVL